MQAFRLNILVADDAGIIHELFDDILANLPIPFDVVHVTDGQQCVDALKAGGIHLAFIDVNMPGMSGIEAVGQARTLGSKTFVTLMSTNASGVRMQLAHQLKVYEFLAKPFSALDVLRVVKTYCRVTVPSNVLVVDDSATVRRIIQKVFATSIFNIDVTEAADGMSALEHCKAGAFHAVFLDCNMPGLAGLETLEQLLARDPGLKVIMISGERNEERRRWALERGAVAFLYKPFNAYDIDRELHALFGLRMPRLAGADPLRAARKLASPQADEDIPWIEAGG